MTTPDWSVEVVAKGLVYPWDIERSGKQLLITEAAGNIVTIENGRLTRHALKTSDPVAREGGAGLLGMALAKDFRQSGVAYVYHSYRSDAGLANKVIEARFDGNAWRETRVLLAGIPGHRLYNGGRVVIGPDGLLYVTTGWTESRERPQDLRSMAGKVLRMTLDGQVPKDNPFPGSLVYSYGHRNPQGLAWNAQGVLFVVEHGQSGHDEINIVKPGANYGWPLVEGSAKRTGMEAAWLESGSDTWAPSGAAFAGNDLLVAALGARGVYIADDASKSLKPLFSSNDRIRDVLPAGRDLYVITTNRSPRAEGPSEDRLLRLSPRR
ncbi:sorbosone dehydrogenase family protein [Variovorax rhizosphaerae]|uniref:Sorbosone dehydrogenase family protein n=1 Tax=Variovorax rhizosphaerae TaxID=1836200 RepID=A0ABU8WUF5_9BURK